MLAIGLAVGWLFSDISPLGAATSTPAVAPGAPVAAARPLAVLTAPVEPVEGYTTRHRYSGELRARRTADLGWESAGRVAAVYVDRGDRVEAGAVLAELEQDRIVAELAGLRAARNREAAVLEALVSGPRHQTVGAARAEVERLEEEFELAELLLARRTELFERNASSEEEVDVAGTRVATVRSRLAAASSRLDELEEGTRAEDLASQRATVAELDARIERSEVELEDRLLRAPFAGVVTERSLDEGAVVVPGLTTVPALRLIEDRALEAHIGLSVERLAGLEEGQRVELEVRGQSVPSTVRSLVPQLNAGTRTADVIIALSPQDSALYFAGEVVSLVLDEAVEARGSWVPTAALVPGTRGLWAAFVVVDERVERRELEVLYTTGDRTLVRGAIRAGEHLVVDGVHRVVPGQHVIEAL